jgi:signal transduction histidine kinase
MKADGHNLSEKSVEYMNKIENASTRMRSLIHDILSYSKASSSETIKEPVNLNDLVKEVLSEFEVKIEEKNAIVECVGELPTVCVTRVQFHQLFLNLLSNALKFLRPEVQPHIQISCSVIEATNVPDAGEALEYFDIIISDNGIGFENAFSDRIFELFNRLPGKNTYEGTGIGLAICKKIVERHGGKLRAEGYPGKGAIFHIYLPVI